MPYRWAVRTAVSEIAPGVFFVQGPSVNWVFIVENGRVTLIDTGYPADRERLRSSLEYIGFDFDDIVALLITHAHTDHIGSAAYLAADYHVPVMLPEAEVPHLTRETLHQVGLADAAPHLWRPRVFAWAIHAIRSGAFAPVAVEKPTPVGLGEPLDIPGHPIPILVPGHTPGSAAYYLPDHKVMVVGDAFVTGHPTAAERGPQMLHPMFHHDLPLARRSLSALAGFEVTTYLPGHGAAGRGEFAAAIAAAAADAG